MWSLAARSLAAAVVLLAGGHALAQAPAIADVTAQFPRGPYTTVTTAPGDPARVAIATESGVVGWSRDGGLSVATADALIYRKMDPVTLRGESGYAGLAMRGDEDGVDDEPRSLYTFLGLLGAGLPSGRYKLWMASADPITMINGLAMPAADGPLGLAGQIGIYVSDGSGGSWLRSIGAPGVMPRDRDPVGLSIAIDPRDPRHILAATDSGLHESNDGGATFLPHRDRAIRDAWITEIQWDPANPELVFLVTFEQIFLSQDGGRSFEPSFAADGDITDLALSPEAAIVATSTGLYLAYADKLGRALEDKALIGAASWYGGAVLAATATELYLVQPDGQATRLLQTSDRDPFVRMAGSAGLVWLVSRDTVLRLGTTPASAKRRAPRLLLSATAVERAVIAHTGLGGPEETMLHARWYAKLLPSLDASIEGRLGGNQQTVLDGTFPIRERYLTASATDRVSWTVWASWDLSELVFGDSNVSNPNLIIESNLRERRKMMLEQVQRTYREAAQLASGLARPPADQEAHLLARFRLEELTSYLEFMSGRPILGDLDLEP